MFLWFSCYFLYFNLHCLLVILLAILLGCLENFASIFRPLPVVRSSWNLDSRLVQTNNTFYQIFSIIAFGIVTNSFDQFANRGIYSTSNMAASPGRDRSKYNFRIYLYTICCNFVHVFRGLVVRLSAFNRGDAGSTPAISTFFFYSILVKRDT